MILGFARRITQRTVAQVGRNRHGCWIEEFSRSALCCALPFETNAYVFAPFLRRKDGQRRSTARQNTFAGVKIETIVMIVAADVCSTERAGFKIRVFVRTLPREGKVAAV